MKTKRIVSAEESQISMKKFSNKKVIVCDLDNTLVPPRSKVTNDMVIILKRLMAKYTLVVLAAGGFERVKTQLLEKVKIPFVFSYYGTVYHKYSGDQYSLIADYTRPLENVSKIKKVIQQIRNKYGYTSYYGDSYVEFRNVIIFPLLGSEAPIEKKLVFDPDKKKRRLIYPELTRLLPENEVLIGGTSSFDILNKGINKAFGIRKIMESGFRKEEIVYIGDDFTEGSNDHAVKGLVDIVEVKNNIDALNKLREFL